MGPVILSAIVTALWIGTAHKAWQLWTAPEDLALRAVTACLACVAAMFSLSLPPVRAALDQADTGLRVLAVNLGTMTTAYLLLAFFTYSVHGPAKRRAALVAASWATCGRRAIDAARAAADAVAFKSRRAPARRVQDGEDRVWHPHTATQARLHGDPVTTPPIR